MVKIIIYTRKFCFYCTRLINLLKENSISFQEREISSNEKYSDELIKLTGENSVPTVVLGKEIINDYETEEDLIEKIKDYIN